jgi:predicted RNA-binding protein YlxR (DUF448 family)
MPAHELLRQVKAKSLSVKIPKNEPNTARLSWVLANEEFLTVEIPRYALERFMVQAKRAIEEAPLISRAVRAGSDHAECDEIA